MSQPSDPAREDDREDEHPRARGVPADQPHRAAPHRNDDDDDQSLARPRSADQDHGAGLAQEFSAVPFRHLIGSPLLAAVDAQRDSAKSTLAFVKGLMDEDGNVFTTKFRYKKSVTEGEQASSKDVELEVPLLVLLPVPFIRVEYLNVKFNVKLTSMHKEVDDQTTKVDQKWAASGGFPGFKASMSGHVTHVSKHHAEDEVKREYSMEVQIHAVQDKMPPGMERVLNLLEGAIKEKSPSGT